MEIHLVSSLTSDDEDRLAPQVLVAIERVLGGLPVSYSVRIETSSGCEVHRSHTAAAVNGRPVPEGYDMLGKDLPTA